MSVALQPDTRPDLLGDFNSLLHENSQTCAQPKKCRQSDRFVAFAGGRNRTFETSAARPWPRSAATSIPGSQEAQLAKGVRKGLPYFFCRIALAAGWQSGVTQSYPTGPSREAPTTFQYPSSGHRSHGCAGACARHAHACA